MIFNAYFIWVCLFLSKNKNSSLSEIFFTILLNQFCLISSDFLTCSLVFVFFVFIQPICDVKMCIFIYAFIHSFFRSAQLIKL